MTRGGSVWALENCWLDPSHHHQQQQQPAASSGLFDDRMRTILYRGLDLGDPSNPPGPSPQQQDQPNTPFGLTSPTPSFLSSPQSQPPFGQPQPAPTYHSDYESFAGFPDVPEVCNLDSVAPLGDVDDSDRRLDAAWIQYLNFVEGQGHGTD